MNEYFAVNRALWDGWTAVHERSAFYNVDAFRAGQSTLHSIERDQVGDVSGKQLLHLQCHFGLDTLSWARLGAEVTGVDFSERAISLARSLTRDLGLQATFVCANVYDLPESWAERFDLVYTSYGAIPWLPDLGTWARGIARVLRPGGSFHLIEFHPVVGMLDDDGRTLKHPYFEQAQPMRYRVEGSYADRSAPYSNEACEWSHSLGDVMGALLSAGFTIQRFEEFPYSPYNCFPFLEEREPGRWYVRGLHPALPLTFAVHAVRRS